MTLMTLSTPELGPMELDLDRGFVLVNQESELYGCHGHIRRFLVHTQPAWDYGVDIGAISPSQARSSPFANTPNSFQIRSEFGMSWISGVWYKDSNGLPWKRLGFQYYSVFKDELIARYNLPTATLVINELMRMRWPRSEDLNSTSIKDPNPTPKLSPNALKFIGKLRPGFEFTPTRIEKILGEL